MSEEISPTIEQKKDRADAAHGGGNGSGVDPSSQTLAPGSLPPANSEATLAMTAADTKGVAGPSDVTLAGQAEGITLIAPPFQGSLGSSMGDATLNSSPHDATLGGVDGATADFHRAALEAAPKPLTKGASFGHYELLEPIAKGGMGIVYKARQRNLNRIVAIKMILAGQFADQDDINRFYAEAEAAAALSHPNIVAIHEIGEVSGQHFFSMDYIEGQSLSGLIKENPLPPRRAAEFMITIAETMEFAHENGVVHRDLKPANVLLDKRQRPLITDFGLAKQVSNTSQLTMAGSIVGTPSYMPPEQAAGKIDEVGAWSDLYSLGAILYELITGRPPFRAASPFETIRQVLETEPPSPRLLNPNVPKDLETICLKCLQKARTNRYGTAQELADELKRFLRGEPIHARPISRVARFWRLCKRYPLTSGAIALAILMLITATVVSTGFYVQASRALVKSDQSLDEAIAAVNEMFTTASEDTLLNEPGMQPLREKLLTKAKTYFERFAQQRAGDPKVEVQLAGAYYRLGEIASMLQAPDDALKPYAKARSMQEHIVARRPKDVTALKGLGDTINALGKVQYVKRDYKAARQSFDEAIEIREKIIAADPAHAENQRLLANTHMNIGNMAQTSDADYAEARKEFEEAQKIREDAIQKTPPTDAVAINLRRDFGLGLFNLGQLDLVEGTGDAEGHFKGSASVFQELADAQPDSLEFQRRLILSLRQLANVLTGRGKFDEAREYYQRALETAQPLAQQNPKVVEYSLEWAGVLMDWAHLESKAQQAPSAITYLERARNILTPLVGKNRNMARCRRDLAMTLGELAELKHGMGNVAAARQDLNEELEIVRQLVQEYEQEPFILMEVTALRQIAEIEGSEGNPKSALEHLNQATDVMRRLAKTYQGDQNQFDLALTLRELSVQEHAVGDEKAAAEHREEAIRLLSDLVKQFPDDREFTEQLKKTQAALLFSAPDRN
jgi:serine/threonine protein kinase/tetratricopeptide (TPR) repeat protein